MRGSSVAKPNDGCSIPDSGRFNCNDSGRTTISFVNGLIPSSFGSPKIIHQHANLRLYHNPASSSLSQGDGCFSISLVEQSSNVISSDKV